MKSITELNGRNMPEKVYKYILCTTKELLKGLTPYARRVQRFVFLPYCFFHSGKAACTKKTYEIVLDFLYIYFILKDYPDNYFSCELWKLPKTEWKYFYGSLYNPYQRHALRKNVQKYEYRDSYENKWTCSLLLKSADIPTPKTLGISRNQPLSETIEIIAKSNKDSKKIICKPLDGKGGHDIKVAKLEDGKILNLSSTARKSNFDTTCDHIIQEFVDQHENLNCFSSTLNTARIITILDKSGEPKILGAYLRIGRNNSLVDNLSSGGMAISIETMTGKLSEFATDRRSIKYTSHPDTGKAFLGETLPMWEQALELAKKTQKNLPFHTLLGLDIAFSTHHPIVIEINTDYDNIDFEQACGPLLKNQDALAFFKDNNLLINKQQKTLAAEI